MGWSLATKGSIKNRPRTARQPEPTLEGSALDYLARAVSFTKNSVAQKSRARQVKPSPEKGYAHSQNSNKVTLRTILERKNSSNGG